MYYDREDFKSAIVALNNVVNDFPDTDYREEAFYLILDSNYLLASNSVSSKQKERLRNTISAYHFFIDNFESSDKLKDAENIFNKANKQLEKL